LINATSSVKFPVVHGVRFSDKRHLYVVLQIRSSCQHVHRVSIKNKQNYFCYNHVKLPPNLIIFSTKMANSPKLYEVHSFSTSPNSRQCTTVLNAHVQNWYITL